MSSTVKTSHLSIIDPPAEIDSYYNDAHTLGEVLFRKFAAWLGRPLDPADAVTEHADLCFTFINAVLPYKGDTEDKDKSYGTPESCYPFLFNDSLDGIGVDNSKQAESKAMKKAFLAELSWEQFRDELLAKAAKVELSPLLEVWEQFYKAKDLEGFGNYVRNSQSRPGMQAGFRLRKLGLLKIDLDALGLGHRKDDFNFLRAVIAVVASRLKTWRTWDFKAEEAKAEAEDKYQKALAKLDRTVYDRFCQFAAEAFDKGYGITRKLVKAVEQNDRKKQHTPVMKLLAQYPGLEETFAEQARTYQAGAYAARLPGRARMTICNRDSSPLALPFGMSTKGYKFSLVVEGQRITPTIRFWSGRGKTNDVILDCGASKYFRDPSISPLCGKKGTLEGYNIAFWRGGTKTATQGEHPSGHAT